MNGELNLDELLAGMNPALQEEEMVFCSVPNDVCHTLQVRPVCTFQEREGTTLILTRTEAEAAGLEFTYPCRMITLEVHSSLEAVGFLARVTALLAKHGISSNTVSAYYHD